MMQLTPFEFISGLFGLIIVSISLIVGLKIASIYRKYKLKAFIFVGLTWIGIVSPWYSSAAAFISILITGKGLSPELYFFLGMAILPFVGLIWFFAFFEFLYEEKRTIVIITYSILAGIYEIVFLYLLFVDSSQIGVLEGPFNAEYNFLIIGFALILLIVFFITGIIFARESIKSEKPQLKLKGIFLVIAFISFTIGTIVDGYLAVNIISLILIRLLVISAAIEFYIGFVLPNWIKKIFLK
ncbi:MAG: hypothetical protein GF353_09650 [Candidatus Lokiarchaeota archaeon]|nr:hypothetical protein [Candidatus Lokiarchaeota archaeon]